MQALTEKTRAQDRLAPLTAAITASQPQVDEALKMVEQVGMSKEEALSQRDRLDISRATAEAKQKLATASRSGAASQAKTLLSEATAKVDELVAQADADETIAEHLPADASQVEAEIGLLTRNDRVQDEFNQLMGKTTASAGAPTA